MTISRPPIPPNRFERIIRRTMRLTITTLSTPNTAGAMRQPSEFVRYSLWLPSHRYSVNAISHLPSGGWTMKR